MCQWWDGIGVIVRARFVVRNGLSEQLTNRLSSETGAKQLLTTWMWRYRSFCQPRRSWFKLIFTVTTETERTPRSHRESRWCLKLIAILLIFTGCNRVQNKPVSSSPATEVFSSTPPFKTVEPDRYQAFRVISMTTQAGTTQVSRTLIAKDGSLRREELLEPAPLIYLFLPQGMFVLVPEARIYSDAKAVSESATTIPALEESSEPMLHEGGSETLYRHLGQEEINGRRLQKYQIVVNSTAVPNVTNSDTFVWVDEELGMPIRTEIRSGDSNRTVIELIGIKREVDGQLFQIPGNYRKVTSEELHQALRSR